MSSSMRWQLCSYTLALALGLSALGLGAVHLAVLIAYASLVCLAGILAHWSQSAAPSARAWRLRLGTHVGLFLTLYCLLQALPLPASLVELLEPKNADIWQRSRRLFDPSAGLMSLSLAPGRTLVEALKVSSYTLVFGVSAALSAKLGAHRLVRLAFALALVVAVVTAAHQVVGAERVYGFYEPIDAYSIAPLLNANNRAGYLNLGFFCGLGVLFRAGARPYAALIGLGLAFVAAEILLCASVGGTGCLALGALLVLILPRGPERQRRGELSRPLQLGIVIAVALGATLLALSVRYTALGLDDRSIEKLDLFSTAARLSLDHPWFGVGRGAFGSVFPAYRASAGHSIAEHAENFPLQWASEWGIPVALAALVTLGVLLASLVRPSTLADPNRRCALVGTAALILQNFVDLGLEVAAIGALACSVLGALAVSPKTDAPSPSRAARFWARAPTLVSAACLVLVIAFGIESPARLRHELHAQLEREAPKPSPEFWAALRSAIGHYPAEPYFPLLGSSAALATGQNALPWIARALERSPTSAATQLELARILQANHRTSQALGALRRAIELEPSSARAVLRLTDGWTLSERELEQAAPAGKAGAELLLLLAGRARDEVTKIRLLESALEHDPNQTEAHHWLADQLWRALSKTTPGTCTEQRDDCRARADEHVERGRLPGRSRSDILRAKLLLERGKAQEAEDHLAAACERYPGDVSCAEELVELAFGNESPRLAAAVQALVATACRNPERCSEMHLRLGNRFSRASEWAMAMGHYRHAAEEAPNPATLLALARAAEHLGQPTLASDARRRAELLSGAEVRGATPPPNPSSQTHPLPPEPAPAASDTSD